MEEDLWSKLMIAPLYDNALDGDVQMRSQWLRITASCLGSSLPVTATDLGCGTGGSHCLCLFPFPNLV